jgi:hypothetical protein
MKRSSRIWSQLKGKLQPRFCWWTGNHWDIGDAFSMLFLIALFLPILPWEPRSEGNYNPLEVVNTVNAASYRELIDLESIRTRYEKEIANDQFRDCVLHRNVLLTLVADQAEMMSIMKSTQWSNVPVIFVSDALLGMFFDKIAMPDLNGIIQEVAKKCEPFLNEYLTVKDVQGLQKPDVKRLGFWDSFSAFEPLDSKSTN